MRALSLMYSDTGALNLAKRPLAIVDLFSGCGGLSLGWISALQGADTKIIAAVDADPRLAEVYAWNFPGARFIAHRFGDSLAINESRDLAKKTNVAPGDVDILLAGPPCQTFSAAGKRELSRESTMVFHVCDFVDAVKPRIVVIENVPQFEQVLEGRLAGRVRVRLSEAGYTAGAFRLNAVEFGVPQKRVRCFMVAFRNDLGEENLPLLGGANRFLLSSSWRAITSREAIDDLPSLSSGEGEEEKEMTTAANSEYQRVLRDRGKRLYNHVSVRHSPELVLLLKALAAGETPQRTKGHPLRRKEYFRAAYARLNPDEPAPTMTTQTHNPGSGRFTHYRDTRTLTVREVARLQGFPDSFRFFGKQETQRRHVGNAVPPPLARAVAKAVCSFI